MSKLQDRLTINEVRKLEDLGRVIKSSSDSYMPPLEIDGKGYLFCDGCYELVYE